VGINPTPPAAIPRDHPGLRRLVPITPLRHFYHLLRDFVSVSFPREAARECERCPDRLQELEAASVAHFGLYDNRGEGFHDRRGVGALSPEVLQSPRPVHRTLSRVARGGILVPSHPELDATYVDYEVSPTRTTAAQYESGAPCRAKGGIDVLLANARDRLPVVAEAKGATDRNLFLGLIQALTYAVELSTAPQRERLARTYPGRFGELLWVGLPAP
jgi:hypothetical protein